MSSSSESTNILSRWPLVPQRKRPCLVTERASPSVFRGGKLTGSLRSELLLDPEGLIEVVLEADENGLPELVAGTTLFCLVN